MSSHLHLTYRTLGIDTLQEHVAFLRRDSPICKSEGLEAQTRVAFANEALDSGLERGRISGYRSMFQSNTDLSGLRFKTYNVYYVK